MKKRANTKKPLDPRVQIGIAIAAPLLMLVIGWMMVVGPQKSQAAKMTDEIVTVQQQIEQAQVAARAALKPEPIRAADIFRLATAMPDSADMPGIILQLSQVAQESGIQFTSISPSPVLVAGTGYETMKIDLMFSGNFYGLSDFLYRLRNLVGVRNGELKASGRLFGIEKLAFAEGKPSFPQIDANLTLDAYVYGAAAASAAPVVPPTDPNATTTTATTTAATTTTPAGTTPPAAPGATAAGTTGVNG
jgi:Tfp pilus assembly protein PilO